MNLDVARPQFALTTTRPTEPRRQRLEAAFGRLPDQRRDGPPAADMFRRSLRFAAVVVLGATFATSIVGHFKAMLLVDQQPT